MGPVLDGAAGLKGGAEQPFFSKCSQIAHAAHPPRGAEGVQIVAQEKGRAMMEKGPQSSGWRVHRWRIAGWGVAAGLLLLPLIAMQFSDALDWDETDFLVIGAMLAAAGGTLEGAARTTGNWAYRTAVGIAVVAAFLLIWLNLAVGIIGNEDNPANAMFAGVLAIAVIGAVAARFRPAGMARACAVTAIAQALVAVIALATGAGAGSAKWPIDVLVLSIFFTGAWLIAARLFVAAARNRA